jgi:hypothetical protein
VPLSTSGEGRPHPAAPRANEDQSVIPGLREPLQVPAQFRRYLLRERHPPTSGLRLRVVVDQLSAVGLGGGDHDTNREQRD